MSNKKTGPIIIPKKGESGKTPFTVLVIYALISKGHRVLAVDCDPQSNSRVPSVDEVMKFDEL